MRISGRSTTLLVRTLGNVKSGLRRLRSVPGWRYHLLLNQPSELNFTEAAPSGRLLFCRMPLEQEAFAVLQLRAKRACVWSSGLRQNDNSEMRGLVCRTY